MLILGEAPAAAYALVSRATLLPIGKDNGGVRPIAMTESFSKLADNVCQAALADQIAAFFRPLQLGVRVRGGVDATVHAHNILLHLHPTHITVLLDLINAFNSVSRAAILRGVWRHFPDLAPYVARTLGSAKALHVSRHCKDPDVVPGSVDDYVIHSASGVRQGGSLSPFLFALAIHEGIRTLRAPLSPESFLALYLDDMLVRLPYAEAVALIAKADAALRAVGLFLNPPKTQILETPEARAAIDAAIRHGAVAHLAAAGQPLYNAACPSQPLRYPFGIVPVSDGLRILGSPSGSAVFILRFLSRAVASLEPLSQAIQTLGSFGESRAAITMTRWVLSNKLRHLLRTVPPTLTRQIMPQHDRMITATVTGCLGHPYASLSQNLADTVHRKVHTLVRNGGGGFTPLAAIADGAYTASILLCLPLLHDMIGRSHASLSWLHDAEDLSDADLSAAIARTPVLCDALSDDAWRRVCLQRDAGAGEGGPAAAPAAAATADDIASWPATRAVRTALKGRLPHKQVQQMLCARRLQAWDATHLADMVQCAVCTPPAAASTAWSRNGAPSARLDVALMHAHGGEGHQWVTDDGVRKDRYGLPRRGNIFAHADAPTTEPIYRVGYQYRIGLPPSEVLRVARQASGSTGPAPPLCQCRHCKGQRPLDPHGHHVLALTPYGELTRRHTAVAGIIFTALRQANLRVEHMEFRPFDRLRGADDEEAGRRLDIVVRAFPLHVLTAWEARVPLITTMLDGVDRTRVTLVDLLVDLTFSHPGARLTDSASDARIAEPDALGDACAVDKLKKYGETARNLSQTNGLGHPLVVYPAPISAFGRLHPLTHRLLCHAITLKEGLRPPRRPDPPGVAPQAHPLTDDATEGPLTWPRLSALRALSAAIFTACMSTALRNADHCTRPPGSRSPQGRPQRTAPVPSPAPPAVARGPATAPAVVVAPPVPPPAPLAAPAAPAAAAPTAPPTVSEAHMHLPHQLFCTCGSCTRVLSPGAHSPPEKGGEPEPF